MKTAAGILLIIVMAGLGYWLSQVGHLPESIPLVQAAKWQQATKQEMECASESCVVKTDTVEMRIPTLDVIKPMQAVEWKIELLTGSVTAIEADFVMLAMDMGINRFQFSPTEAGAWQSNVIIPICLTGRRDWVANIAWQAEGKWFYVSLPFETLSY